MMMMTKEKEKNQANKHVKLYLSDMGSVLVNQMYKHGP